MTYKHIILGGGCAGLSLCYHLLENGETEPILLIDQRSAYEEDRTWSFWDIEETPFTHLSTYAWQQWVVHTHGGSATQTTSQYRYCHLPSKVFYDYVLSHLRSYPNLTLQFNERVHGYVETSNQVAVTTENGQYVGQYVIDARGLSKTDALVQEAQQNARWIPQQFVGQRMVTERPVFEPSTCTLMDFRVSQNSGLHFVYVLPYSPTEALVENVYMDQSKIPRAQHLLEIESYMSQIYRLEQDQWRVYGEETGYIPMTDFQFPKRQGKRIFHFGMRGGQTRAASGYTFVRIQRTARQLASALMEQNIVERERMLANVWIQPQRYGWLDSLFLRFMERYPEQCPELYRQLFAQTSGDTLARFMTERSYLWDDLAIVLALPIQPFVKIALQDTSEKWLSPASLTIDEEASHALRTVNSSS